MANHLVDITNQRFGRLLCLRPGTSHRSGRFWICICDCGTECEIRGGSLRSGLTRSCGCLRSDKETHQKHGQATQPTGAYRSWISMRSRCRNPKCNRFQYYGGRGITICDRWDKFENFLADMGDRPVGRTLDRINVNGNYEPSNCRWATPAEQLMNRRPRGKPNP